MPRKFRSFKVADLRATPSTPIPAGGLRAHVLAVRNRASFVRNLICAGAGGHVVSGTSVVKEAQLLRHLVDKGLVEAADVPGEKVRFTVTSVGQAHPELAPLIREAQLFDLAQTKAREAQAMRRAPSMPIAEAQGILGRIPQIKRAFEDLWGRRETPGHQRLLDANLFRPHARAFKALETAGVLKIEGNRFRANQVALSLTDEGKRSSIISMLAV